MSNQVYTYPIEGPGGGYGGIRPKIICLCGSTKFFQEFRDQNLVQTLQGNIVLSIGCDTKADHDLEVMEALSSKIRLDELHKRKIDLADEVLIINKEDYIGESTRSEIEYAIFHQKPVRFLYEHVMTIDEARAKARADSD